MHHVSVAFLENITLRIDDLRNGIGGKLVKHEYVNGACENNKKTYLVARRNATASRGSGLLKTC
jgi:hypothetical protein